MVLSIKMVDEATESLVSNQVDHTQLVTQEVLIDAPMLAASIFVAFTEIP